MNTARTDPPGIAFVAFGIILDTISMWVDTHHGMTRHNVLGGGGAQTAWGMALAAGDGEGVGLVGGIHQDTPDALFAPLHALGIDLSGVRRSALPTPRAHQFIERDGRRTQVWLVEPDVLEAQLARRWERLPPAYQKARGFHWGIHPEAPDLALAEALAAQGRRVSLEAFRGTDQPLPTPILQAIMRACAIFSATVDEALQMTGAANADDAAARMAGAGCRVLALRMGAAGSAIHDFERGRVIRIPAFATIARDATGAGNAYCGALLARWDDGAAEAACHGTVAASYVVEQIGIPAQPPPKTEYQRRFNVVWKGCSVSYR
jgi:sugar/nucleoside kinase (ribokinase family)